GTIYSDATHKTYTVSKNAFGRIPSEPILGDIVTIDKLVPRTVNKVESARIRGLVPKKSNFGTILGVILFFAAVIFIWKSGVLEAFDIVKTETPVKLEAPSLLHR
ncbi:MAG: hypothetical protein VZR14_08610, partial [Hallerella sp.]|nr:hypothetical protein [Hallerella sp.]